MLQDELFERGLQVRREVLGREYVDGNLEDANTFTMASTAAASLTSTSGCAIWLVTRRIGCCEGARRSPGVRPRFRELIGALGCPIPES